MMLLKRLVVLRVPVKSSPHTPSLVSRFRGIVDRPQSSPTRYKPDPESSVQTVQNEFVGHTMFAFKNLGKVLAYVGYGSLILGLVTATAFEGAHFWIERQMCVPLDEDAERWGWEPESWTGGDAGGTSPALGFYGRHAVRAAWFTLRYGSRFGGTSSISRVHAGQGMGSLNVVDSDLEGARVYLEAAMARIQNQDGRQRADRVGLDLLERHAAVLERIGTRAALTRAREEYCQILDGRAEQRHAQARLAVKLGDLSERLGDDNVALSWWSRAVSLTKNDIPLDPSTIPPISTTFSSTLRTRREGANSPPSNVSLALTPSMLTPPPSLPAAQRTFTAAMLSLSAFYSKRKQLPQAQQIQEHGIKAIEAMVPTPDPSSLPSAVRRTQSSGQTLHHMYLLHRKSVLAIHHAEVTYAIASSSVPAKASPVIAPLTDLLAAASSSEVVCQVLTGLSLSHPDLPSTYLNPKVSPVVTAPGQRVPHPPSSNAPLAATYQESPWLRVSAHSVLRDARLTAAEAWDLCGILYREQGNEGNVKSLECFERALSWVGEPAVIGESHEGMGVDAWHSLWERYVEARERVLNQDSI